MKRRKLAEESMLISRIQNMERDKARVRRLRKTSLLKPMTASMVETATVVPFDLSGVLAYLAHNVVCRAFDVRQQEKELKEQKKQLRLKIAYGMVNQMYAAKGLIICQSALREWRLLLKESKVIR